MPAFFARILEQCLAQHQGPSVTPQIRRRPSCELNRAVNYIGVRGHPLHRRGWVAADGGGETDIRANGRAQRAPGN